MPGKETAPQSAQCERDHGDGGALDDAADSRPKWVEVAVIGNLALRENNHQIALLQRLSDLFIGSLERLRVLACGSNRNCASGAKNEVEHRDLENLMIHDEAHRTRAGGGDHQRVHVAHVVAHQDRGPRLGDVLEPGFLDRKSTRLNSSHITISYAVF